jgi:methylenetetrahydrofolate dehydrogenase (NADP+) / methenyltetrahydrofolate cyclohydrolase
MILLDGKATALSIQNDLRLKIASSLANGFRPPGLVAVLVGEDPASHAYVRNKALACKNVGIYTEVQHEPGSIPEGQLIEIVQQHCERPEIDGIIVQLPLPKSIDPDNILNAILPTKDVDGFTVTNSGKLMLGMPTLAPATPLGIVRLLQHYQIATDGKHVVVVGRSRTVGTPVALILSQNSLYANATVTLCHSHTVDLRHYTQSADILIVAAGKHHLIAAADVKAGTVVIDVGIHAVSDSSKKMGFRYEGDVNFAEVAPLCSHITPVPGGVGPMTIAMLLSNTVDSYQHSLKQS